MKEEVVGVSPDRKHLLTIDFLHKVEASSAIYLVNPDGYVGISVAIESGFAYARGIPVYAYDMPSEPAVAALVTAVKRPEDL